MKPVIYQQSNGETKKLKSGMQLKDLSGLKAVRLATWGSGGYKTSLVYLPGVQLWGIGPDDPNPRDVKLYGAPQLLAELVRPLKDPTAYTFKRNTVWHRYSIPVEYKVSTLLELLAHIDVVDLYALPLLVRKTVATQRVINELEKT